MHRDLESRHNLVEELNRKSCLPYTEAISDPLYDAGERSYQYVCGPPKLTCITTKIAI